MFFDHLWNNETDIDPDVFDELYFEQKETEEGRVLEEVDSGLARAMDGLYGRPDITTMDGWNQ